MNKIAGEYLYHAASMLARLRCEWDKLTPSIVANFPIPIAILTQKDRENGGNYLAYARSCFESAGLKSSVAAIDEFAGLLRLWNMPAFRELKATDAIARLDEIERAARREMKMIVLMFMSKDEGELFENPLKDWDEAVKRWPQIKTDVEEASRCFSCGRYAATIFHSLLVAELGVIQIGNLFGVSGDKPGWGCVSRLEKILEKPYKDRTPFEQTHSKFLQESMNLIYAAKDWRHKITHVDNRLIWLDTEFGPQKAEEIMLAARGLMRYLALELPK